MPRLAKQRTDRAFAAAVLIAFTIAVLAVLAGAALGLFGGRESVLLQPVYAFGVVAAIVVVAGHLMPEAAESLGVVAIGVFAVGLAVPTVVERLVARGRSELNVGFIALVFHQFGDGAALGAAAHSDAVVGVGIAIAAHTVPLVTLLMALMLQEMGAARAWTRAALMALATVSGVLAVQIIPKSAFVVIEPYASAVIGGILLHVVLHTPPAALVRPVSSRVLELAGIGAGVAMALFGNEHRTELGIHLVQSFVRLGLTVSPALLCGLVLAAGVQTLGASMPLGWTRSSHHHVLSALRGAVIGVPLPVCTCGVLPTARALLERGAAPALLVAFLVAAPVLGLDTFLVTMQLVGLELALARVLCVVAVAIVAALALTVATRRKVPATGVVIRAKVQGPQSRLAGKPSNTAGGGAKAPLLRRFLDHFDELVFHVVPWTAAGLLLASYLDVLLVPGVANHPVIDVLVVLAIAVPTYMSASAVTPLAAVLLAKGVSPGAVLAGLVVGPATDIATIGFLRRSFGVKATVAAVSGVVLAVLVAAETLNRVWMGQVVHASADGWVAWAAAMVLIALALRSIWQSGVVAWAEALSRTPSLEWRVSRAYARL